MIYLISQSPQRRDVLNELGVEFEVFSAECEETTAATPAGTVFLNACRKAAAAWRSPEIRPGSMLLAADTVVEAAGRILGKPADPDEAAEYLNLISGREISVYTAVAVIRSGDTAGSAAISQAGAKIKVMTAEEIAWYVGTGEPLSRAGAFGISRRGEIFIEKLTGSYSCFAGLPKRTLGMLLAEYQYPGFCDLPFTAEEKHNIRRFTPSAGE